MRDAEQLRPAVSLSRTGILEAVSTMARPSRTKLLAFRKGDQIGKFITLSSRRSGSQVLGIFGIAEDNH